MKNQTIELIRRFSREVARELQQIETPKLGTTLSESQVNAMIELSSHKNLPACELTKKLGLEKSSVSRLVNHLLHEGFVAEKINPKDKRFKLLCLTKRGTQYVRTIHKEANNQVANAIAHLSEKEIQTVIAGFTSYTNALKKSRHENAIVIRPIKPGDVNALSEIVKKTHRTDNPTSIVCDTVLSQIHARKKNHRYLVLFKNNLLIGSIRVYSHPNHTTHIDHFYFASPTEAKVYSSILIKKALSLIDKKAKHRVRAIVHDSLACTLPLFFKAGFESERKESSSENLLALAKEMIE